jgi:hypothetical protein
MYELTPPVYSALRFYILMAVTLKITDFCDMTSCTLLETYPSSLPPIYPECRGRTYLRDAVTLVPDCTALHKRHSTSSLVIFFGFQVDFVQNLPLCLSLIWSISSSSFSLLVPLKPVFSDLEEILSCHRLKAVRILCGTDDSIKSVERQRVPPFPVALML